jgi:mono/diheme cytochrome c family protein
VTVRGRWWGLLGAGLTGAAAIAVAIGYVRVTGLDSRAQPGPIETRVARLIRGVAIPAEVASRRNPVALTPDVLEEGMAHFADHCASCHAADGSGNTELGRGLYPRAPDMRAPATQRLTDGALFYIIEHGTRFTGMPGWSTGTTAGEESSWHLVHVIRHLPQLTGGEVDRIKARMPRSPEDVRQEIEEERFLNGEGTP